MRVDLDLSTCYQTVTSRSSRLVLLYCRHMIEYTLFFIKINFLRI